MIEKRRYQAACRAVEHFVDELVGLGLLHLLFGDDCAAHEMGFGSFYGALLDTAFDDGARRVDVPANLVLEHFAHALGGAGPLAPKHVHNLELGVEQLNRHDAKPLSGTC